MRSILSRLPTATLLAVTGYVHFDLWRNGYRALPNVGVLFLLTTITAAILAVLVLARPIRLVLVAVAAFSAASLGGLLLSRTTIGVVGYTEAGWSQDATATLAAEVGAVVAAAVLAVEVARERRGASEVGGAASQPGSAA